MHEIRLGHAVVAGLIVHLVQVQVEGAHLVSTLQPSLLAPISKCVCNTLLMRLVGEDATLQISESYLRLLAATGSVMVLRELS